MSYKKDFPIFKNNRKMVYLDSAATSQKPQVVIDAVNDFFSKYNSNVHRGIYTLSEKAEELYEGTRKKVAGLINAGGASEIIFTGNATEAINLAAFGYFKKFLKKDDIVVLSEMEHHSNVVPWLMLKKSLGIKIYYLPVNEDYRLDHLRLMEQKINFSKVKLISLTHASNVLGTVNPLEEIIPSLKKECTNAKILIDAAQSIPHIPVNVKKMNCDFLAFSSHKMFGPSGVGVLYARQELLEMTDPLFYGGHMIANVDKEKARFLPAPAKFEAGTGKLEGVAGLGAAIDYLNTRDIKVIQKYEHGLTKYTLSRLPKIKNVQLYGSRNFLNRLPVFSFNIGAIHPHDVSEILNRHGVCVRAGHHCAQVLMDACQTAGTVRASLSIYNTKDDVDKLITSIEDVKNVFRLTD